MDIAALQAAYATALATPEQVIAEVYDRIEREGLHPVWISLVPREQALLRVADLATQDRSKLPLFGVPFAVKDNIDVAGMPTTAACPAFAYAAARIRNRGRDASRRLARSSSARPTWTSSRPAWSARARPTVSAPASSMRDTSPAGRAPVRPSRSPTAWSASRSARIPQAPAACPRCFNQHYRTQTDTRPAQHQGFCPPAARSIASLSSPRPRRCRAGAHRCTRLRREGPVLAQVQGLLRRRTVVVTYSRRLPLRRARASQLEFFGDAHNPMLYAAAIDALMALGGEPVEIDLQPFLDAAQLLYKGPWIAERYAALATSSGTRFGDRTQPSRTIISGAAVYSAADAFHAAYKLEALKRVTERDLEASPTPCCSPPHPAPTPSMRSQRSPSSATATSATTPTSSTCSISLPSRCPLDTPRWSSLRRQPYRPSLH